MATSSQTSSSNGIGFLGALCIAFIVLKLVGVITWSWVWVLAPVWIPFAILVVILAPIGIYVLFEKRSDSKKAKQRRASRSIRDYGKSFDRR